MLSSKVNSNILHRINLKTGQLLRSFSSKNKIGELKKGEYFYDDITEFAEFTKREKFISDVDLEEAAVLEKERQLTIDYKDVFLKAKPIIKPTIVV